MLNENIKTCRKSKGLSQDELAIKLNVVRQTVSKWERGLSVPDSEMLLSLSEVLEVPVSKLLDENIEESEQDDLKVISEKLEVINLQLAQKQDSSRKVLHGIMILLCICVVAVFIILLRMNSSYLNWNYSDPESAVAGTFLHGFEWIFMRVFPFVLVALIVVIIRTRKKHGKG